MKVDVTQLLEKAVSMGASDLHLSLGVVPIVRVNTFLQPLNDYSPLSLEDIEYILGQVLDPQQKEIFEVNKELDLSLALGNKARVRVNAFYQRGYPSLSMRVIPMIVPRLEDLSLPESIGKICELDQGLVLVVGPTGHGKSTTIAAMIDRINSTRPEHIITIEDPVEYVFTNKKSLIEQREMYLDTHSWDVALKSVLRQDPNVVMIGEMRDSETMTAALQIAETGHLVFATLHTNSASQTVERIISSFPDEKRSEVRLQFAQVLEVVISQRLLPSTSGKLIPAVEILLGADSVRNLIREGRTHMIDNIINTSYQLGMVSLERSLADLVNSGVIDAATALRHTTKPEALRRLIKERR